MPQVKRISVTLKEPDHAELKKLAKKNLRKTADEARVGIIKHIKETK